MTIASMPEDEASHIRQRSVARRLEYTPEIISEKWRCLFQKLYNDKYQGL